MLIPVMFGDFSVQQTQTATVDNGALDHTRLNHSLLTSCYLLLVSKYFHCPPRPPLRTDRPSISINTVDDPHAHDIVELLEIPLYCLCSEQSS